MKIIDFLIDMIYPPRCVICGEIAVNNGKNRFFCEKCGRDIPWVKTKNRCKSCTRPLKEGESCSVCQKHDLVYTEAVSVFDYAAMKKTIEDYKFNKNKYLHKGLGYVMSEYAKRFYPEILEKTDIVCPLPVHKNRLKQRGFDQSALLARIIGEECKINYGEVLVRVKETSQQSLMQGYKSRCENVKDAFEACGDIYGKTVMVIDDVLTTGSSANECAKALFKAGAKEVIVYTLSASFKPLEEFNTYNEESL